MPTVKTISFGGGSTDYSSISSWFAAATTGGWEGDCYYTGALGNGEFLQTSGLSFSGFGSASPTNYILLTTGAGQKFSGTPLRYDATQGVGIRMTNVSGDLFTVSQDYMTVRGLQIFQNSSGGLRNVYMAGQAHSVLDSCICESDNPGGGGQMGPVEAYLGTVINTVCISRTAGLNGVQIYTTPTLANNTIVAPSDISNTGYAINQFAGGGPWTPKITNCAGYGHSSGFCNNPSGTPTGSNNASDGTISFGSNNKASTTYANQFVNTTAASRDFRLKTGADCIDNGATDTTDVASIDIIGTSRPQGSAWDIGAWELVQASTPTVFSPIGGPVAGRPMPMGTVQTFFAPISTDPETTTVDRWHQALSTPRGRGYPAAEQAASFWGNFTPVGPETVTVDKWFKPLSEPYLKRSYPASEQTATPPWFSTAKETTTLDRWFEPFSVPYGLKYPASQQPAVSLWSTFTPAPTVVPALDSWLQSLGLPQPLRFPVEKTFWSWGIPGGPGPTPPPVVQPPPQGGAADDDEDEADRRRRKWLEWNRQRLLQKRAEQAKQAKAKPPVEALVAETEAPGAEEALAPAPPLPADKSVMADMLLMANLQATQMANAQKNEANAVATKAAAELVARALAADREDDDEAAMMLGGW